MSRYNNTRVKFKKGYGRVYSYSMYPKIPIKNSDIFKGQLRIPTQIQDILTEYNSMNGV